MKQGIELETVFFCLRRAAAHMRNENGTVLLSALRLAQPGRTGVLVAARNVEHALDSLFHEIAAAARE